ncbi:universal stress protein [Wenzhouxiangella sp. XN79A]|nr:universal stress protein [Wenzhouxiangella sp. XN79A]
MQTIMVATDLSERSDRALRRATLLAREFDAGLILVHVVDDDQPQRIAERERADADALLRDQAAALRDRDGVACDVRVVLADPFLGIVESARAIQPDLLLIGPHRRQVLRDVFIGTTAERTIHSVDCPVLMANAASAGPYRHLLLTTDLSESSGRSLERVAQLRAGWHAHATLLHLYEPPPEWGTVGDDPSGRNEPADAARADLQAFVDGLEAGGVERVVRAVGSSPAHGVLRAADDLEADLIMVGTRGSGGLARFLIGSVAEEVLRRAERDVLAVPPFRVVSRPRGVRTSSRP